MKGETNLMCQKASQA